MLSSKINVKEALEKTSEITVKPKEIDDKFSKYSPIYIAPTSNVIDLVSLYTKNDFKSALVVGSQGAIVYELLLNGIKKIDCFDKNILQYFFYELLNAAIMLLDYEEFIHNFTAIENKNNQNLRFMFNEFMISDLIDFMIYPSGDYWWSLQHKAKINSLLKTSLFRTNYNLNLSYLSKYSSLYNEENFYKLKKILYDQEVKIDYHICDIEDIHKEFKDKKYDLIMFDNILQYYKSIPALDNVSAINRYVKDKLDDMLNNNGQIQLGYGFMVSSYAVCKIIGREYNLPVLASMRAKLEINEEIKNGFISNMIKKYDKYVCDFIPGVETNDYLETENLVLTYKKSTK